MRDVELSRLLFLTASFALAIGACTRPRAAPAPWLVDCVFDPLSAATSCPVAETDEAQAATPLAPAADLVLRSVAAERRRDSLTLDVALEGNGFWNAADQNVYVFVGDAGGGPVRYALSALRSAGARPVCARQAIAADIAADWTGPLSRAGFR